MGKDLITSDSSLCNVPLNYLGLAYAIYCIVVLSGEMLWNGFLLNVLHLIYIFVICHYHPFHVQKNFFPPVIFFSVL